MRNQSRVRLAPFPALLALLAGGPFLAGCNPSMQQIDSQMAHTDISLSAGDLHRYGIGFLTPSAATGREADKQALALAFSKVLQEQHPDMRVAPLPSILSALNAADMDQEYKQMYRDYTETGILDGGLLNQIGRISGVRYLAQLSISSFEQDNRGRFGILGLRMVETKASNMRFFIQIWDSQTGAVAWEGGGELNYAYETSKERPVTFQMVAETAATRLFANLPQGDSLAQPVAADARERKDLN
jgi:hypothetical protein